MASAKVVSAPRATMAMGMRPTPASVSVRQASFFGPRLNIQRAQSGALLRAREAVKVEARSASKAGQQIQVREGSLGITEQSFHEIDVSVT